MQTKKKILITIFSIISILFGLSGAILSFGGIFILNSHKNDFDNINNLSLSVGRAIEDTSQMLKNSDETSGHIAESIRITNNTIIYASEISYDSGIAFNQVAGMVGFEILGYQPFGDAGEYFSDIGNNLIGLSEELSTAQGNLETNASDLERIGKDLENIAEELGVVSARFNQTIGFFSIYNFVTIIKYLLVYVGILNVVFILNGIMFLILRV